MARTIDNRIMPKPLVCLSSGAGNRDNASPSANHDFMTRLTVDSRAANVITVAHSQSVSLGDFAGLSADPPRRQLLLAAGFFTPGGWLFGNHVDGMVGLKVGHIAASLEIVGEMPENKNPAGYWSGRGSRKIE